MSFLYYHVDDEIVTLVYGLDMDEDEEVIDSKPSNILEKWKEWSQKGQYILTFTRFLSHKLLKFINASGVGLDKK